MATHLKLPYTRWLCQVSTGEPRPKAGYIAMMEENLTALQRCAWRKVSGGESTLTPHDFTRGSYFDDKYDAFKMTGAWSATEQKETAFAGMAAYVFKLPDDYATAAATLVGVELPVSRDRYCLGGVRVAVALGSSDTPSGDWSVVRGAGAVATETGLMNQADVPYVTKSAPAAETVTVDLSGTDSQTKPTHMIVYVTLEDYTDHWAMYSAKEARNYAVEGSAILSGAEVVVEFSADVAEDSAATNTVKVRNQFYPQFRSGLLGWVYAACWFSGRAVSSTTDEPITNVTTTDIRRWISYPGGSSSLPRGQISVNDLYSLFERGTVHVQQASGSEARCVGASFAVAVDRVLSGMNQSSSGVAAPVWCAYSIFASSYLVPLRMPYGFSVRRITLTWNNTYTSVQGGEDIVEEDSNYANVPSFVGTAAQAQGYINVWIKPGAYVDSFTEPLLKNPRIYDASEAAVDGWLLIGQIRHADAAAKIISFDLASPITAPVASLLFTAFLPADNLDLYSLWTDTVHSTDTPYGVCPVRVGSFESEDLSSFVPDSGAAGLTFVPGIILEG